MAGSAPNVYRPSAFLRIQIRLEDFTKEDDPNLPSEGAPYNDQIEKLDKELKTLNSDLAEISASNDQGTADQAAALRQKIKQRRAARKKLQSQPPTARGQEEGAGDQYSVDLYTVPVDLNVEMNSFRMADTMNAIIPFIDAPLISDIIRAALIEVWIGTVPPEDFATADHWRLRRDRAVIVFRGYADSWETNHTDGDATVSIQARSMEAILIDAKINAKAPAYRITGAGGAEKISTYINRILGQLPATSGRQSGTSQLKAVWYGSPSTVEPSLDRKSLLRSLQSAKSRVQANGGQQVVAAPPTEGGGEPGSSVGATPGAPGMPPAAPGASGQEMSVWDLITQACELAGCLPTYDPSLPAPLGPEGAPLGNAGDFLLLRPPQTMFENIDEGYKIEGGAQDGFNRNFSVPLDSETVQTVNSDIRFMIWGKNIKSFKTSRKLGRVKVQGVEVRSYNPDAKASERTLVVRFPTAKVASRIGHKGEAKTQELQVRVVRGIRDPDMLKQIAVGLYHSMSRQEMSVSIETNDMSSYIDPATGVAGNDNPDMLKLRPGSPCRVAVARQVTNPVAPEGLIITSLSEVFEKRGEALKKLLIDQRNRTQPDRAGFAVTGSPEQMADRIVKSISSAKINDVFYCRTIAHKFTVTDGWSATLELVNYLTARADPKNLNKADHTANEARKPHPRVKTPAAKNQAKIEGAVERAVNATENKR
jgi:hypothetical protein